MVKRIDRYIGRTVMVGVLSVWIGLTLLMMMFGLLDELGDLGQSSLGDVFWFVIMTAPRSAYQVFPVSALLGSLIGLGGLAATNELVAFRTAGASRLRIAGSALGSAILLTLPVLGIGEWVAPAAEEQARAYKSSMSPGDTPFGGMAGIWMRDGDQFVNIQRPVLAADRGQHSVEFRNIKVYTFDDNSRLTDVMFAREAVHDGQQWNLNRVRTTSWRDDQIHWGFDRTGVWASSVNPELLGSVVTRPRYMSMTSLVDQMQFLQVNGLDDRVYRSAFWAKVFFPLTVLSLVLAGMPFVFGSARHHSMGVRLFIGMSLGGVFMIVSRAVQNLGDAYLLPATLTTAAPSIILAGGVFLVLRRSV